MFSSGTAHSSSHSGSADFCMACSTDSLDMTRTVIVCVLCSPHISCAG